MPSTADLAPVPLTVYACTHCTLVRKTQCSKVCRLDIGHPDTISWDAKADGMNEHRAMIIKTNDGRTIHSSDVTITDIDEHNDNSYTITLQPNEPWRRIDQP